MNGINLRKRFRELFRNCVVGTFFTISVSLRFIFINKYKKLKNSKATKNHSMDSLLKSYSV